MRCHNTFVFFRKKIILPTYKHRTASSSTWYDQFTCRVWHGYPEKANTSVSWRCKLNSRSINTKHGPALPKLRHWITVLLCQMWGTWLHRCFYSCSSASLQRSQLTPPMWTEQQTSQQQLSVSFLLSFRIWKLPSVCALSEHRLFFQYIYFGNGGIFI